MSFRINRLLLPTGDIKASAAFYALVPGLRTAWTSSVRAVVHAGDTELVFQHSQALSPAHFAFGVSLGLFDDLCSQLGARIELIPSVTGSRVHQFPAWDAASLYFRDPSGNIVEIITRTRRSAADTPPAEMSLCEVGVVSQNVPATAHHLSARYGITPYRQDVETDFTPLGHDGALLIVVREGRPWYPTADVPALPCPSEVGLIVSDYAASLQMPLEEELQYPPVMPEPPEFDETDDEPT